MASSNPAEPAGWGSGGGLTVGREPSRWWLAFDSIPPSHPHLHQPRSTVKGGVKRDRNTLDLAEKTLG